MHRNRSSIYDGVDKNGQHLLAVDYFGNKVPS